MRLLTLLLLYRNDYVVGKYNSLGKDGAFMALWSAPYFMYCVFASYTGAYILNDRAWADVVLSDKKMVPNLMNSLVKEL